jgi:class 3 adenylate cyclase
MGEVVVGNVGAKSRMHYAMVGRAVNVAHSLVDLAEDGQIVISKTVYEALRVNTPQLLDQTGQPSLEHHHLKGDNDKHPIYRFSQTVLDEQSVPRITMGVSAAHRRGVGRE